MGSYPVPVVLQDTIHKITHITQNNTPYSQKHSTQSYTNNKGHMTHNEYNTQKSKAIPITGLGGL
jgi:hypothetical protein